MILHVSRLHPLLSLTNAEGKIVTRNELTIDLRDFIEEAKAEGEKLTRKQALDSLKELEKAGIMKINKKIDKNRFLVQIIESNSNGNLLPGFEPYKL